MKTSSAGANDIVLVSLEADFTDVSKSPPRQRGKLVPDAERPWGLRGVYSLENVHNFAACGVGDGNDPAVWADIITQLRGPLLQMLKKMQIRPQPACSPTVLCSLRQPFTRWRIWSPHSWRKS